jgi:imidazole glycerol-phosphate synthase subunit HisH
MAGLFVIDYKKGGNIFSVANSLERISADFELTSSASDLESASKIIFPGVGSFSVAMSQIEKLGLKDIIIAKINSGTPFLGICVGMQVLFDKGLEAGDHKGLSVLPGVVSRFSENYNLKIPEIGWNQVKFDVKTNPLFEGIQDNSDFYFVHSYRVNFDDMSLVKSRYPDSSATKTSYGEDFISSIWDGKNLFATQFHPEKSGELGLKLLSNFVRVC